MIEDRSECRFVSDEDTRSLCDYALTFTTEAKGLLKRPNTYKQAENLMKVAETGLVLVFKIRRTGVDAQRLSNMMNGINANSVSPLALQPKEIVFLDGARNYAEQKAAEI